MAAKQKDPTFDKSELIAVAPKIFGVNPEILVGALHETEKPISIAEAKKKLETFLNKPVKGAK